LQREWSAALIAGAILWIDKLNSARRRLLKRHTDIRNSLPSDAAFSQRKAGVEGKVEFGRKIRGAWKMQAGTVIAQIPDNAVHRRAVGQNDLGALEYFGPWKSPTLKHGQHSNLQF